MYGGEYHNNLYHLIVAVYMDHQDYLDSIDIDLSHQNATEVHQYLQKHAGDPTILEYRGLEEIAFEVGSAFETAKDYKQLAELLQLLQASYPEVYNKEKGYLTSYLMEEYLRRGDWAAFEEAWDAVTIGYHDLDILMPFFERLIVERRTDLLKLYLARELDAIISSGKFTPWALNELANYWINLRSEDLWHGRIDFNAFRDDLQQRDIHLVEGAAERLRQPALPDPEPFQTNQEAYLRNLEVYLRYRLTLDHGVPVLTSSHLLNPWWEFMEPQKALTATAYLRLNDRKFQEYLQNWARKEDDRPRQVMPLVDVLTSVYEILGAGGLFPGAGASVELGKVRGLRQRLGKKFS